MWFCLTSRGMLVHSQVAPFLSFKSNAINVKEHKRVCDRVQQSKATL